ncbi:MAG: NAD(P)-dependent oxidoreductase [Gemmatimonadetes bacterium]|jgi:dTDP-L-rhamnose 4-epimerase|nr:NAD(P)-dependent oxidoreductase [Gemmatimonadota bacterium]MBT7860075.1 NAD(P)-dependent oxidoreductase [Gemmatimonadota bacterium]
MKRILVTGGAGFIGSHTVDRLLGQGYDVRILDLLQERVHPHGWPSYLPDVEKIRGDVRDPVAMRRALADVDGVVHLAAYQDYMPDFSTFYDVNTTSTALLFEIIVGDRLPVERVVLASSQSVYGEGKYECGQHGMFFADFRSADQLAQGAWEIRCPSCNTIASPVLIDEETVKPHTAYGISKYALELTSLNLGRKYDIGVTNMRYSIVQGPRNSFFNAYSGIARIFALRLLHGQPPIAYEDGHQRRDYVHVSDVAQANVMCLEHPDAIGRCFNVAGQQATTVLEAAQMLARACDRQDIEPVVSGEYRFGDTRHTVSTAAALERLGWQAQIPLQIIYRDYVDWVRRQPDLADFYARSQEKMRQAGVLRRVQPGQVAG